MKLFLVLFITLMPFQNVFPDRLKVVTTYPYITDIVRIIGKDNVEVTPLARGDFNPHVIIPKPSYIAKMRQADLLIINGAQLEIGWLPPIMKQANNANVQPGEGGFLDLSTVVPLMDIPTSVSREQGDVHPEGNPHFSLNPDNIPAIVKAISGRLCTIDPENTSLYQSNSKEFIRTWENAMKKWEEELQPLKGARIVEYHKVFDYFLRRFGLVIAGTIEPLPGIPPTTKHIEQIEKLVEHEKIRFILQDVYNPQDASQYLSKKLGVKMIVLPHDVGAVKEADGILALFEEIVRRLTQ